MLTIEDLSDSLGLSEYQVRRRIKALDDMISDHIKRGNNSKIMVDSGGLEMLKRLKALREEGLTIDEAVEEIRTETQVEDTKVSANQHKTSVESELLRERINHLESENNYLRKKLDQKEDQIQQLLPATREEEKPEATPWKLFKNWLFKPR